jgi:hypothetical protein
VYISFFEKKKAKEKGAIQKQAERWSVFRSTSFPNKRILIFLSFFLQRDMKTIFSSLCDFFSFFFPGIKIERKMLLRVNSSRYYKASALPGAKREFLFKFGDFYLP